MTYYLYLKPDGQPDVTDHKLRLDIFPGYEFVSESEKYPEHVRGKRFVDGQWVSLDQTPNYVAARKLAYPKISDQLDALWHAMNDGLIPQIEPMYSEIKAVKEANPKPSN